MVSGIIPINAIIYEHWLYLPLIGFFTLLAFYLDRLFAYLACPENTEDTKGSTLQRAPLHKGALCRALTWLSWLVIIGYLLFFAVQSIRRNLIWGNPIAFYEEIIRYNPGSIRILNNLGNIYSDKGRLDDAARIYEQIIADKNNIYPQPYYNLGNIYRDRGDTEKAAEYYKLAIEKDNNFPFAYQNLASIYVQKGQLSEAIKMLEEVKRIKPADPIAYYNLALMSLNLDNKDKAMEYANQGLGLSGSDIEIKNAFSKLLDTIDGR